MSAELRPLEPGLKEVERRLNTAAYSHGKFFNDFLLSRGALYGCLFTGFFYTCFIVYLLAHFADTVSWIVLVLLQLALIGVSALAFLFYSNSEQAVRGDAESARVFGARAYWMDNLADGLLVAGIIFAIIALLYCYLVFKQFKHIKTAINVLDAAAEFAIGHGRVMAIALGYYLFILMIFFAGMHVLIYLTSMNDISMSCTQPSQQTAAQPTAAGDCIKEFSWNVGTVFLTLFTVVALMWLIATINLCSKFLIMCSAATYYFNSDDEMEGSAEVLLAFSWTHLYHLGTLAYGASVLTVVSLLRILFVWWAKKVQNRGKAGGFCACLAACADCGLGCVE